MDHLQFYSELRIREIFPAMYIFAEILQSAIA